MSSIRNHVGATIACSLAVGMCTMLAAQLDARAGGETPWSLDQVALTVLPVAALYGGLFWLGHRELRKRGHLAATAYAMLGAVSAILPFVLGTGPGFFRDAATDGSLTAALIAPLIIGSILGTLYRRYAGFETADEDPDALAMAVSADPSAAGGLITTATAEYYDGPLQVRLTLPAMLAGAIAGAAFHAMCGALIFYNAPADMLGPFLRRPAFVFVAGTIALSIPYFAFVVLAATFLRARNKQKMSSHISIGFLTPILIGIAFGVVGMGPAGLLVSAAFIVPSAIAMGVFRKVAGLEPVSLPDDIEVTDRTALVPADHVRRRVVRVIDVSR